MGAAVHVLCALTALACAVLLLRAFGRSAARLLMWSGLCFALFALSNALIVVDLVVFPEHDLFMIRSLATLLGLGFLLYGLIWDAG